MNNAEHIEPGPAGPAAQTAPKGGVFGLLRRLYDWTLSWARTPWGAPALGLLSFTEAVIFPIPPDPLLMALALSRPAHAFRYAALATAGSVTGAVAGYAVGVWLWQQVEGFFFAWMPGFTPENFALLKESYQENAFLAIFAAAFTPIPFKVFTIASGVFDAGLPALLAGSVLGRGIRFFAVAGLLRWIGEPAKRFIDRHFNLLTVVFLVLLVLGFWVGGRML